MFDQSEVPANMFCSFCGKHEHQVRKLVAGPAVQICDACIAEALLLTTDGMAETEVSGGSYSRVAVTNNNTNFPAATSPSGVGTKLNATAIIFPQSSGSWGTVTHFAIFDAASAGNMLIYGTLTSARAVTTGDTPKFLASGFSLTAD